MSLLFFCQIWLKLFGASKIAGQPQEVRWGQGYQIFSLVAMESHSGSRRLCSLPFAFLQSLFDTFGYGRGGGRDDWDHEKLQAKRDRPTQLRVLKDPSGSSLLLRQLLKLRLAQKVTERSSNPRVTSDLVESTGIFSEGCLFHVVLE